MLGGKRRTALRLHDRADEFLHDVRAPSAPVTDAVVAFVESLGDYDESAGEVITEPAKSVLMFSVMRGYTLRMASNEPLHFVMPAEAPGDCLTLLSVEAFDDDWFFVAAFPQGAKVWRRLSGAFAAVANAMLLDDQPHGPTWPPEVIDDAVRVGYIARCIDEWFDLRPLYQDALS